MSDLLLKAEFLVANIEDEDQKRPQSDDDKKNKKKGRIKDRPPPIKFNRGDRLCPVLVDVDQNAAETPKCLFPGCAFKHDVAKFMEEKAEDISGSCHVFNVRGRCPRGVTCRFASAHVTENGRNVVNQAKVEATRSQNVKHALTKDLQKKLWKKDYDFEDVDKIVDDAFKAREEGRGSDEKRLKTEKPVIDWKGKIFLAPLTTVGNLPFRRICKRLGVDITCGEMAMTEQLLKGHQPEWALVHRHPSEDIFGVQICGSSPQQGARLAALIRDGHIDADFVDLNLGCPIDLVYKRGMGSGMMARKKPLEILIRSMTAVLNRPLTVKMRTGVHADKHLAPDLAPAVFEWGADLVTVHGRSREQRYTRSADWDFIKTVKERVGVERALFGNGDVMDFEAYEDALTRSGADGVMIARGALIKPWVFTEIKERRHWDISAGERLDIVKEFAMNGLEHWGSDDKGVETTRRFLLEWLSFLHRYVPVGLLERPPQKINERLPRKYVGRSDLETKLASSKCSDWIELTEMFLGKVPDGFRFEPKHRANAY